MNQAVMLGGFMLSALVTFMLLSFGVPVLMLAARIFGLYATVDERTCRVYVLFGKVLGTIDEPGFHFLPSELGLAALIVNILGTCYVLDLRLDQEYRRSEQVNSEEGAPMGIGIWYEMWISDPYAYLFKNTDPRGSLRANVSNATVRCLSNMPLADMLETRHTMSQTVRAEVSSQSQAWGYQLGSVYIRKVHFRDDGMIRQIANQVNVITSSAERTASIEFGKASAIRPNLLGQALREIAKEPVVSDALFTILETQRLLNTNARVTLLATGAGNHLLPDLLAARGAGASLVPPRTA
jgi:regulator of protease activity HflC (stomatin/prohibitin superfamily)